MQAFQHYERASSLGHAKATTKLGHFYYSGIKKHINIEITPATVNLGDEYWLEPDKELSLKKYIRAGRRGDSEAYNCAGLIIEPINAIDAVDMYKKAIALDNNNTDAMFNMALLYYSNKQEAEWHE